MVDFANSFLRQDLNDLLPYSVSPVTIANVANIVKLDANENPFGPSPRAMAALADTSVWNYYASQEELLPAMGDYVGVGPEHLVAGNGADEVIDVLQRITINPGDAIIDCTPSFEMYSQFAILNRARVIEVPRRDDFYVDIDAVERAVAAEHPKIVFIANPSNPDGSIMAARDVERLLALPALVVLDEAYAEIANVSFATRVVTQPNLIVIRTFSKWAGLAGLRIGYAIAPLAIAERMMQARPPYNVNAAAIVAARASLEDVEYLNANLKRLVAERERLAGALRDTGYLNPLPSCTNFLLARSTGRAPLAIKKALAERQIMVRAYTLPRLRDYVRISVGTPEQDDRLLAALNEIGKE